MSTASKRPATGTHCHECGYTSVNPSQRCPSCGARRVQPSGSALPPPLPGTAVQHEPFLRRRLVVGGIAVLVLAAVIGIAVSGDDSSGPRVAAIPESLDEAWQVEVIGTGNAAFVGSQVVVVATDDDVTVSAHDGGDGEQRWTVALPDAVSGAVVPSEPLIVQWRDGDASIHLSRLSPDDGELRWDVDLGDAVPLLVDDTLYVAERGDDGQSIRRLQQIDTGNGELGATVEADRDIVLAGDELIGHDTESVRIYQRHTLRAIGEPIAIDDDTVAVALWEELVVAAEGDELTATDRLGRPVWKVDSPVDTVESLMSAGGLLVVDGEDGVAVVRRTVAGIEEVWRDDAALVQTIPQFHLVAVRDGRTLRLLREDSGEQVLAAEDASAERLQVLANGVLIFSETTVAYLLPSVTKAWETRGGLPEITAGGAVMVARGNGGFTVVAYR